MSVVCCDAGVLREVVLIGGGAALGALVPLAAGAHCASRTRHVHAHGHAHAGNSRDHADSRSPQRVAATYRPYHKFIGTTLICCLFAHGLLI